MTASTCPLRQDPSSESRKATAAAMSSGLPKRGERSNSPLPQGQEAQGQLTASADKPGAIARCARLASDNRDLQAHDKLMVDLDELLDDAGEAPGDELLVRR
jgi:hypothetical protein